MSLKKKKMMTLQVIEEEQIKMKKIDTNTGNLINV
jgi:hypothetical protein